MATGDIKWFQEGVLQLGTKIHNLTSDALQLGIVTTATVPTMATAIPHWGGTGRLHRPHHAGFGHVDERLWRPDAAGD